MPKRFIRPRIRSARRAVSALLHFCLLLSLWRAPVPWVHAHDTLDEHAAADTRFWAEHLERFHTDLHGHSPHGWHWHFVFPWELADKHDDDQDGDDQHPQDVPESVRIEPICIVANSMANVRTPYQFGPIAVVVPDVVATSLTASPPLNRPIGVHVLLTFSNRISWRALACIALC